MCISYCNICGCRMKAIPSFCYTFNICSGATRFPHELTLKTYQRVGAVVIPASSNFSNKIIFPEKRFHKVPLINLCVFVPYYKPHPQSAFKHEHIFNQAVKHPESKGHQSWSCSELFCPPWWRELGWRVYAVAPKFCSLCA